MQQAGKGRQGPSAAGQTPVIAEELAAAREQLKVFTLRCDELAQRSERLRLRLAEALPLLDQDILPPPDLAEEVLAIHAGATQLHDELRALMDDIDGPQTQPVHLIGIGTLRALLETTAATIDDRFAAALRETSAAEAQAEALAVLDRALTIAPCTGRDAPPRLGSYLAEAAALRAAVAGVVTCSPETDPLRM